MLNWRRDPDYERRMHALRIDRERIENDILQIEKEILLVRSDSERIKKETEQLRRENARQKVLNASIRRLCVPPETYSIPVTSTDPDSMSFSP
jgi:hypothetical protein